MHTLLEAPVLDPDSVAASQIEEALLILQHADKRIAQADRYLSSIRSSPLAWPACTAIIRNPKSSLPALMFAASTIRTRTAEDWPMLCDDSKRFAVFNLALEGLKSDLSTSSMSSLIHFFGRTCGFCLGMASSTAMRAAMWDLLVAKVCENVVSRCKVLAAVVLEINCFKADHERYSSLHLFYESKAVDVLSSAISVLNMVDVNNLSAVPVDDLRAAVSCVSQWKKYADMANIIIPVLCKAICISQIADDVAETLNDMVGFTATNIELLVGACEGLIMSFQAIRGTSAETKVHHAIAEVVCALSDGNADEIMEQNEQRYWMVAEKSTDLLRLCVDSYDDRTFFAAVEAWSSWITAAYSSTNSEIIGNQIPSLLCAIVERLSKLEFVAILLSPGEDDVHEFVGERTCVTDLLEQVGKSLGLTKYLRILGDHFNGLHQLSLQAFCAYLFAITVAGEDLDLDVLATHDKEYIACLLRDILTLLESWTSSSEQQKTTLKAPSRAALNALSSFASFLVVGSDSDFYRGLRCVGRCIVQNEIRESTAKVFFELADANPIRVGQFLGELVSSIKFALPQMSDATALYWVRGLARIASVMSDQQQQMRIVTAIVEGEYEIVMSTAADDTSAVNLGRLGRALRLISASVQELNDNEVAMVLFERLKPSIFKLAIDYCAHTLVAEAICRFLAVCVSPTQLDDTYSPWGSQSSIGHHENNMGESRRLALALSLIDLAGECFRHSGESGETAWIQALCDISPYVLECLNGDSNRGVAADATLRMCRSLENCLHGLETFTKGNYDTQPTMTTSCLRYASKLLHRSVAIGVPQKYIAASATAALKALKCMESGIVREALLWWDRVFKFGTIGEYNIACVALSASGGTEGVANRVVWTARHGRCSSLAAEVLFGMCRWLGGMRRVEPLDVLRACLASAFQSDGNANGLNDVAREGLRQYCSQAAGSFDSFKAALREVGKVLS